MSNHLNNMKKNIFFFLLMFNLLCFGQTEQNTTGLKKELVKNLTDSTKVTLHLKIANLYADNNTIDSANHYYNKALNLAKEIDCKPLIARTFYNTGLFYEDTNNYEKAIKNYIDATIHYEEIDNLTKVAQIYNYVAYCYTLLYVDDSAINYYLKSLTIHKKLNDEAGMAMNYLGFGDLFYTKGNYSHAKKYFKDAANIYEKIGDIDGVSICYTNYGNATAEDGNNTEGLEYYRKSIEIQKKLDDQYGIGVNYNNIGDSYLKLKEYDEALDYFFKALKIAKRLDEKSLTSIILMNISDVKIRESKYSNAIEYAKNSLKIAEEIGDLEYQANNLMHLSNAYEGLGNPYSANKYNKLYIKIKDSLIAIDKTSKVKLFQALNDLDKSQYTINDLSTRNEITTSKYESGRKYTYFLVGSMVLFGLFVIILIQQQASKRRAYDLLEYKNHQMTKMSNEIETQRDYLKQLNKTKDKFFSIIAHDLKNPFNSIKGFTELMIENSHEYDEEKRLKFLKIIKGSTSKASSLLNNLLIWANSQSGNLVFNPQEIELIQKVSNVISLLEIQAINKEITITNHVTKDIFVNADKNMLATILRNLISNAIKFTETKGVVQVSSFMHSDFVEISVKDNGIGINKEDLQNLFSIEVKNSSVGTANEQGSGLGLILCKEFVEKHGGKLWVESSINDGTEFKFTMPIAV